MKKIIHCDADCFFAAVEMRDDPSLRHIPLAIGGSAERRGVISTCNYEARRFGIHSAMASWQALKLCPSLVLLPHSMEKYRQASAGLKRIFADYSESIEMVSVDEAYLDVTDSELCRGSATLIATEIRNRVKSEIGITLSAGVATNKFLAKVASEWQKPDGLFVIKPGEERVFVDNLPIKYIHGVGKVTAARLARLGITHCKDIQQKSLAELIPHFGSFAVRLKALSEGIDNRPVNTTRIRKSLSVEHTFTADLASRDSCLSQTGWLCGELMARLKKLPSFYQIKKVQVKLKFANFSQTTLEKPCEIPTVDCFSDLIAEGTARNPLPVRLLGVGVQFMPPPSSSVVEQMQLFG
ncbi:MAG: DNA polymerase IV [Porticoccaceae bacterium]